MPTCVVNLKLVGFFQSINHSVYLIIRLIFLSARIGEVDSLLTNAHTGGKLSLRLPLGSLLLPVVKALRYQESLWDLDLSYAKLDDHLFQVRLILDFNNKIVLINYCTQSLCEALSTLPHLVNLDLKGNLITAAGLTRLAESLRAENITGLKVAIVIVISLVLE